MKAKFPYVSIKCPHSGDSFLVKEGKAKMSGNFDVKEPGMWLYDGQKFTNLDDVLDYRLRAIRGEVTRETRKPSKGHGQTARSSKGRSRRK